MEIIECLARQVSAAKGDKEFCAASVGLGCGIRLEVTDAGDAGIIDVIACAQAPVLALRASGHVWRAITAAAPPVGLHSFTAACRQASGVKVDGSQLHIAQALHTLERLFEILRGQVEAQQESYPGLQAITGAYASLMLPNGEAAQVFYERSGNPRAPVLLMLHTAGADARQFHSLLADAELQQSWNMLAFDLPSHGRSMPLTSALWENYKLTKQDYIDVCQAFIKQVVNKPVVLLGCSMGAAMALKMAVAHPRLIAGVLALEAPFRATGRRSPMLAHAQVNQGAHNPSYVRGLMSPLSPLFWRRVAAWIYSQGGFQVYAGDLSFYSDEFDAEIDLQGLDGHSRPVVLLTGAYDYSAAPADTQKVANLIPGAHYTVMPELGHFPMVENPRRLLDYLKPELERIHLRLNNND
ncbi:alpha/beta hydrolase [Alcaligenaceae bacterium]|nr:alpha/beta hydrolase [Alcaligenaceae bacterium]